MIWHRAKLFTLPWVDRLSGAAAKGRENGLRGQKLSQIILDGKYARDLIGTYKSSTALCTQTQFYPRTFLTEVINNTLITFCFNSLSISAYKGPAEVKVLSYPECSRRWEKKLWLTVQQCVNNEEIDGTTSQYLHGHFYPLPNLHTYSGIQGRAL